MTELEAPISNQVDIITTPDTSDSESSDSQKSNPVPPTSTDVGKRVVYYSTSDKKQKYGILRFFGETEFSTGTWCGVELNNASGKNNGTFKGIRYFTCPQNHGVFVPINKIELDFGRQSRSRPGSSPGSRSSSVDRDMKPSHAESQSLSMSSPGHRGLNTFSIQQQLVSRLSTPVQKRKTSLQPMSSSRRQPLKAFATKGVNRDEPRETRKSLTPFRSGGMVKAQSTENLRSLKDSGNKPPGMPSKKSSSERDLRGVGSKGSPSSTKKDVKLTRKNRVSSCSDLTADPKPNKTKQSQSSVSKAPANKLKAILPLPRTSTPRTRNEIAPDGCSSPDDDSGSNTSQADEPTAGTPAVSNTAFVQTPEVGEVKEPSGDPNTPSLGDTAFVQTPESELNKITHTRPVYYADTSGMESATKVLIKKERAVPSFNQSTVASPEHAVNKCYKNRPSGSATLSHPLTQHTGTQPDEDQSDGLRKESLVNKLLDPTITLEGVSLTDVVILFREQHRQNAHQQAKLLQTHKTQLEKLQKESHDKIEKIERQHRGVIKELVERHHGEIMALNRAHGEELKVYR